MSKLRILFIVIVAIIHFDQTSSSSSTTKHPTQEPPTGAANPTHPGSVVHQAQSQPEPSSALTKLLQDCIFNNNANILSCFNGDSKKGLLTEFLQLVNKNESVKDSKKLRELAENETKLNTLEKFWSAVRKVTKLKKGQGEVDGEQNSHNAGSSDHLGSTIAP